MLEPVLKLRGVLRPRIVATAKAAKLATSAYQDLPAPTRTYRAVSGGGGVVVVIAIRTGAVGLL